MGKLRTLAIIGALVAILAGCGGDQGTRRFFAEILSDPRADGDIGFNSSPPPDGTYLISQADSTGNLLFGIDLVGTEFRAFLHFPLDGSTGGGIVPPGVAIISADIEVFVNNVELTSTVPTLLDLVPFPTTGLAPTDFDSPYLATRDPFNFFRSDIDNFVRIDVTSLMAEALDQGLPELQLRFLLDFVPDPVGLVELDDGADSRRAPLLTVEYW